MTKPILFLAVLFQFFFGGYNLNSTLFQKGNNDRPIIVIGDTQRTSLLEFWREKNKGVTERMFERISAENPRCVLHCGDMVFQGSSKKAWKNFEHDAQKIFENKIPIYPVLGNHEYLGSNKSAFKNIYSLFPFLKESTWYSRRFDNLGVIFLNSNFGELTEKQNKAQIAWYKKELEKFQADNSIDFVIVICHHPPFTNSTAVSDNADVQEYFVTPFESAGKTKIFLSGHCHSYERFAKDGKYYIVSGGGGGPRQKLKPQNRNEGPFEVFHGPALRDFNYCRIVLTESKLKFSMIKFDKDTNEFSTGDSFELLK